MVIYLLPSSLSYKSPFQVSSYRRRFRHAKWSFHTFIQKHSSSSTVRNLRYFEGQKKRVVRINKQKVTQLSKLQTIESEKPLARIAVVSPPCLKKARKKRRKYSYESNQSIARTLDLNLIGKGKSKGLKLLERSPLKSMEVQDMAADHAYRRVQLFYYLSVIYYKSECLVEKASTILQHGKSKISGFSAEHS